MLNEPSSNKFIGTVMSFNEPYGYEVGHKLRIYWAEICVLTPPAHPGTSLWFNYFARFYLYFHFAEIEKKMNCGKFVG